MSRKRKSYIALMRGVMYACSGLTAALLLFLLGYVLYKGIPNISWEFLSTKPSHLTERIGILPDILNTVYIVLATLVIVLPLGVGAAIYLTEYAQNKRVVAAIEYAAETLSGIPSIIYGLVGMLLFSNNFGTCLLAGALTLVIMNLPTVMRTTQESLKTVPQSYREGAFGLGAGKWRVIRTVVLPGCVDGVITGCILSVGRILGESAALLFTAGFGHVLNDFFTAFIIPTAINNYYKAIFCGNSFPPCRTPIICHPVTFILMKTVQFPTSFYKLHCNCNFRILKFIIVVIT